MDLMGTIWEVVDLINLAQDRDQWRAVTNLELKLGFYKIPGISLVAEELLTSEEEILSHGVFQFISKTVV
jgi:hypothetical protein